MLWEILSLFRLLVLLWMETDIQHMDSLLRTLIAE